MIFNRGPKPSMGKGQSSINGAKKTGYPHAKELHWILTYLIAHTKMNSKWINDLKL